MTYDERRAQLFREACEFALLGPNTSPSEYFEMGKAILRAAYPQNAKDAMIDAAQEAAWAERKMQELGQE